MFHWVPACAGMTAVVRHRHIAVIAPLREKLGEDVLQSRAPEFIFQCAQRRLVVASVEYLIKQFLTPDKKNLDLSNQNIGDKGAIKLSQSKDLRQLKKLVLPNNNISDEGVVAIANSENFKQLTDLDIYGNVISNDGVKAIAESPHMSNLRKLSLYGNLVEDEGAIAIAESRTLSKLKHLFITSNRIRRDGIESLKKAKCRTRLCHLYVDDLKDFYYEEVSDEDDEDLISSWEELKTRAAKDSDAED